MSDKVNITINGISCSAGREATILEACREAGIEVPTLCFMEDVASNASCGVCVVEVKNAKSLVRSCVTKVSENMEIMTNTERVRTARKTNVELLLANHPKDCLTCMRNQNCELQTIASDLGIKETSFVPTRGVYEFDETSPSIIRDPNKCILCGRCVEVCSQVQDGARHQPVGAGGQIEGVDLHGKGAWQYCLHKLRSVRPCMPLTGAIVERDDTEEVFRHIMGPEKRS